MRVFAQDITITEEQPQWGLDYPLPRHKKRAPIRPPGPCWGGSSALPKSFYVFRRYSEATMLFLLPPLIIPHSVKARLGLRMRQIRKLDRAISHNQRFPNFEAHLATSELSYPGQGSAQDAREPGTVSGGDDGGLISMQFAAIMWHRECPTLYQHPRANGHRTTARGKEPPQ